MIVMDMHLHSDYSDGKNSLEEMVLGSIDAGYTHITFTDHVCKTSGWLEDYIYNINKLKNKYIKYINIYTGVEAKVLDQHGNIDLDDRYYGKFDYIYAAFHGKPLDYCNYIKSWHKAFINVLKNPDIDVIAHPTSEFNNFKAELDINILRDIVICSKRYKKRLEVNIKRGVPDSKFLGIILANQGQLVIGSDSHSAEDIQTHKHKVMHWNEILFNGSGDGSRPLIK